MKQHIVIIDDEAPIRDLLAQFLAAKGYRTTKFAQAAEALDGIRGANPDLIICDLQLEDADGLALIEQLKVAVPDTPIILMTGVYFDPETARKLVPKKIACYLQKTTPLERIGQAIRRVLPPVPSS